MKTKGKIMEKTLIEQWITSPEDKRLFEQEGLILECTSRIYELMDKKKMSKSELARKLKTTKGHITQLLSGRRNMRLRTLADIFFALDATLELKIKSLTGEEDITEKFTEQMENEEAICVYTVNTIKYKPKIPPATAEKMIPQPQNRMAG